MVMGLISGIEATATSLALAAARSPRRQPPQVHRVIVHRTDLTQVERLIAALEAERAAHARTVAENERLRRQLAAAEACISQIEADLIDR